MTIGALDRVVALTPVETKELGRPQAVVEQALEAKDFGIVVEYLKTLKRTSQLIGINAAATLHMLAAGWQDQTRKDAKTGKDTKVLGYASRFGIKDELVDVLASQAGLAVDTTKKYIAFYSALYGPEGAVPEALRPTIMAKPVEHQIRLTAAAGELSTAQWQKVAKTGDLAGIREIVQAVRGPGKTSSASALHFTMKRDGTLVVRKGPKGKEIVVATFSKDFKGEDGAIREAAFNRINRALHTNER